MIILKKNLKLNLYENTNGIEVEYTEQTFNPTENTGITLYDKYKISIMLTSGMFAVTKNKAYKAEKGDIFVFRPDEIHFAKIVDADTHKFLNIFVPLNFFDTLNLNAEEILDLLQHKDRQNLISPSSAQKGKILVLTKEIAQIIKNNANPVSITVFSRILDILLLLSEYHKNSYEAKSDIPKCVTDTLDYLYENYSNKISLNLLAKNNFCSVTYLSKVFKKHTGYTIYEQLTNIRLINAKRMLSEGKNVTEVSFECGFTDCSHFIKTFKKHTGLTPYQYKTAE